MAATSPSALVALTQEHRQALSSLEEAAALFSSPDPAQRSRGETVFLQLRQSHAAVEHALYALEQSHDPFVHFQCLSVLLEKLSSLGLRSPSASLESLTTLRDFLLALIIARSTSSSTWPKYTRSRALQVFGAVQVRLLGIELEEARRSGQAAGVIEVHSHFINAQVVHLISLPNVRAPDAAIQRARFDNGVGLAAALLDELANAKSYNDITGSNSSSRSAQARSRFVDHTSLSPLQLRWVKSWMQEQVLPHLLEAVVHGLSSIMTQQPQGQVPDEILPSLAALINVAEKLFRWRPILSDPWAGLSGAPLSFEATAQLLNEDELSSANDDEDDNTGVEDGGAASGAPSVPVTRYIPRPLVTSYLSREMIALMASAYRMATQLDTVSNREAVVCLSKLRRCILAVASFAPAPGSASDDIDPAGRQDALLEMLKSLRDDTVRAPARLLTSHGTGLLFLAQMYSAVLSARANLSAEKCAYGTESTVHDLAVLSNDILTFAFSRRRDSDEEEDIVLLADETVNSILSAWLALCDTTQHISSQLQVRSSIFAAIVKPFIDARLHAAAVGSGDQDEEGVDDEELGEETQSDQDLYENTLVMLATLARYGDLAACLTHLHTLSESVSHDLATFYTDSSSSTSQFGVVELKALEHRWEALHWLLLMTGHILADVSKGEVATVPREIISLSDHDQKTALHLIRSLSIGLLQLLANAGHDRPQSPQVMQTILWLNARLVPAYMMAASTPILSAQLANEEGKKLLALLVALIERTMAIWLADGDVISQVSAVLRSFALSEGVMQVLLALPPFEALVKATVDGLGVLPAKTHKALVSALVGCVYASASRQAPQTFFDRITTAIEQRLSKIVHQPNFTSPSVFQHVETVDALMNALDMFDGLAASAQPKSAHAVFAFLSRFFDTLVGLAHMYKDRSEVGIAIVRIIRTLVGALDLGFGAEQEIVQRLNDVVWRLLEGMPSSVLLGDSGGSALDDEAPFDGLCLVLDMLNDLLLASDADGQALLNEWILPVSHHQTADVCLFGFSRLVPVMQGNDVLSVAQVRTRLAHLTSRLLLSFGHRLVGLVVHETISTAATVAHADTRRECGQLYAACVQALALSLGFDETSASLDALEGCDALTQAAERVLTQALATATAADAVQRDALSVAGRTIVDALLSPLLDTTLRMLLFEPLAPSMLDALLNTHHQLLHVIVTTDNLAWQHNESGGDQSRVQHHLDVFCASTPLVSLRTAAAVKADVSTPDEMRRRTALSQTVSQLTKLSISMHTQQPSLAAEDKQRLQALAREVAWNGRSEVQLR